VKTLEKLLRNKKRIRVLETTGYSTDVWWDNLKLRLNNTPFEVNGISMDDKLKGREKYSHLFIGRLDRLLKKNNFIKSFPYDFVNLDYYGGGRWFNQRYQYEPMCLLHLLTHPMCNRYGTSVRSVFPG